MIARSPLAAVARFEIVDKINLRVFYELGAKLGCLSAHELSEHDTRVSLAFLAFPVKDAVASFLSYYHELKYCRSAGEQLVEGIEHWRRTIIAEMAGDDPINATLRVSEPEMIELAKKFEHLLLEELQAQLVFRVTQTAGYETVTLLTEAERNFPDSAKMKLRSEVVVEIRESGKCLAYGTPTAAGFHILRALELVMIDYYFAVCKPSKMKPLPRWQAYINALKKEWERTRGKSAAKVIAILVDIGASDRNLIMHPKRVLTPDEALGLFKQCESAIISMADKLPQDKQRYIEKLAEVGIGFRVEGMP